MLFLWASNDVPEVSEWSDSWSARGPRPAQSILRLWKDGEVRQGQVDDLHANGNSSNVLVLAGRKAF
jgi:hypothetical protein